MSDIWFQLENLVWNIFHRPTLADWLDILIIAFLLYQLILMVRRTRAIQVIKGIAILILIKYVSDLAGFSTLSWLMKNILNNGVIALIILFQPEFRKALEQLGRGTRLERRHAGKTENDRIIDELSACLISLAKRRVGALIVIEGKTGLQDVMETGTVVDAVITKELLENIFEPNTPLHDGAVIIREDRVAAAACVLTLSDSNTISSSLGTRHRAGLGISETTDATVLIVSEETGIISLASGGRLTRYLDEAGLREILGAVYNEKQNSLSEFWNHLKEKKGKGGAANDG